MKKIYLFFALALMLMLGSCNKDEPNNESSSIMIMYNRAVNTTDNSVTFSQSNCKFTVRNDANISMQANMILKVSDGSVVEFTTDFMPLTACSDEAYTYTFEASNVTAGLHTVNNLRGKINLIGPTFIHYVVDGQYHCYSTLQPYYTYYSKTNINTQGSTTTGYMFDDISYGLTFNSAGDKGSLYLFDFHTDSNGRKIAILRYDNLTLVPTATGYQLTGSEVVPTEHESTYDALGTDFAQYRANTISLTVSNHGQSITGTIEIGNEDEQTSITLSGRFFESLLYPVLL